MSSNPDNDMLLTRLDQIDSAIAGIQSPWMTTSEAANYLRCSVSLVEKLTREGKIPFYRQNPGVDQSPRLYHRKDLTAFIISGKNTQVDQLNPHEKKEVERLLS